MLQMFTFAFMIITTHFGSTNIRITYATPDSSTSTERFDRIIKIPGDRRSYRGLVLGNRMKVLLMSDRRTKKSAASMVVGVGALDDPREVPGLAHLFGYELIAGSKKYPEKFGFRKFVEAKGGKIQLSFTNAESQIYSFEIPPKNFPDALDRFAQFFIAPSVSYLTNQHAEHAYQSTLMDIIAVLKKDDNFRIESVEKLMSKANHPYNHIFFYTNETHEKYNGALHEKMKKFYSMRYSSNVMSLAVLGKENLDELEKMVTSLFENVEDKDVKRILYTHKFEYHPWGPEQLKHKIYILPAVQHELRLLRLNFPVPDILDLYHIAPDVYISYLMDHKGPRTLQSLLRKKEWCKGFKTNYTSKAGIAFFTIECHLTYIGLRHIDEIVNLIFQYIHLLNSDGVQEEFFKEIKLLKALAFRNTIINENEVLSDVESAAINLQNIPFDRVLSNKFIRGTILWDSRTIRQFLCHLRPDNLNMSIISAISLTDHMTRVEEIFRTSYGVEKIADDLLSKWKTKESMPELQLPPLTNFIPNKFTLYPIRENEPRHPKMIHKSQKLEMWFKQDDQFKIPLLHVQFHLTSSMIHLGPFEEMMWRLFYALLIHSLDEHLHYVKLDGFEINSWGISLTEYGLHMKLCGYEDKISIFLEKMISKIANFETDLDEETFDMNRKKYIQNSKNVLTNDPSYIYQLQHEHSWALDDILNAARLLRYNDMKKFVSRVFKRISILAQIHGNSTRQKAMEIVNIFEATFVSNRSLLAQEKLRPRFLEIPSGFRFIHQIYDNKGQNSNIYYAYFQFNTKPSLSKDVAGHLLNQIVQERCHEILPSDSADDNQPEKVSSSCTFMNFYGMQGFIIMVLSEKDFNYVDLKVEKFLKDMPNFLKSMPKEKFKLYKEKSSLKPTHLPKLSNRYWYEITNRFYEFDRAETKRLLSLSKNDLYSFFQEMLDVSSCERRKFVVNILPKEKEQSKPDISKNNLVEPIKTSDFTVIWSSSVLLPIINSYPLPSFE